MMIFLNPELACQPAGRFHKTLTNMKLKRTETITIDWHCQRSIDLAERQKEKLETAGYQVKRTAGSYVVELTFKKRRLR
jgi:hypothetical protein